MSTALEERVQQLASQQKLLTDALATGIRGQQRKVQTTLLRQTREELAIATRAGALGVFDSFVVCSPRAEDFRAVSAAEAPSLGLLDPVLIGRIGSHSFLIAQWDLAKDLAEV